MNSRHWYAYHLYERHKLFCWNKTGIFVFVFLYYGSCVKCREHIEDDLTSDLQNGYTICNVYQVSSSQSNLIQGRQSWFLPSTLQPQYWNKNTSCFLKSNSRFTCSFMTIPFEKHQMYKLLHFSCGSWYKLQTFWKKIEIISQRSLEPDT